MQLTLTDKNNKQKAIVLVDSFTDNLVQGSIMSFSFDEELKQKITQFEELVNSFVIGELLDEVTEQLDAYQWQVKEKDWEVFDFQIFEMKYISFRIKNTVFAATDFTAELTFLTTEKGGRKTHVQSGYRPHIAFNDHPEHITSGQQKYINQEKVEPGETVKAEISILSKEYFTNRLYVNMIFKFCEGPHIMGYGKIMSIKNMSLQKRSDSD